MKYPSRSSLQLLGTKSHLTVLSRASYTGAPSRRRTEVKEASLLESNILRNFSCDENRPPTSPTSSFKVGARARVSEAVTSEFIAKHTRIPVLHVIGVFMYDGQCISYRNSLMR